MRILVLTNHLANFAGSEIVAVEVASEFRRLGCDVAICASYFDEPIRSLIEQLGFSFLSIDDCPAPDQFEVIWSQHQALPYLLSKYETKHLNGCPLELPTAIAEVSDVVIANSPETAAKLADLGVEANQIRVFYNAAPDEYIQQHIPPNELEKLLIVSNHMPEAISKASEILKNRGITVDHIGRPFTPVKITPTILQAYDAVITIGKTAQYCVLSEIPVYVYDRFGGPGWLDRANFEKTEWFNFSGRCCHREIAAAEIADEVISGFTKAAIEIQEIKKSCIERYRLQNYVEEVLSLADQAASEKRQKDVSPLLRRIGAVNGEILKHTRDTHFQQVRLQQQRQSVLRLEKELDEKKSTIETIFNSHSWKITKPLRSVREAISRIR